jgi:hypothetical protein
MAMCLMPHLLPWSPHLKTVRSLSNPCPILSLLTMDTIFELTATLPKATYNEETGRTSCTRGNREPLSLGRLPVSYSFGVFDGYMRLRFVMSWLAYVPSLSDPRSLRTLPHLRSPCWIRLYRSCSMSKGPSCPRASLASLIRARCLRVWLLRKSATRHVGVKYIRFEKALMRIHAVEGCGCESNRVLGVIERRN